MSSDVHIPQRFAVLLQVSMTDEQRHQEKKSGFPAARQTEESNERRQQRSAAGSPSLELLERRARAASILQLKFKPRVRSGTAKNHACTVQLLGLSQSQLALYRGVLQV